MAFPLIQIAALALSAYGVFESVKGQQEVSKASKKQERLRRRQSDLEANRRRREAIREGLIARAQTLSTSTNQGASFSSGVQGGQAQITGQTANNILGINQGQELGNKMFGLNRDIASGQIRSSTGQGLTSFGQLGFEAFAPDGAGTRIGNYISGRK